MTTQNVDDSLLVNTGIERMIDEWSQASCTNMFTIEVGIILAFPAGYSDYTKFRAVRKSYEPGTVKILVSAFV